MAEAKDVSKMKNVMQAALSLLLVLSFLAMNGAFVYKYLNDGELADFAIAAIMSLINFTGLGVGYFLGSSKGSADKTAILERQS